MRRGSLRAVGDAFESGWQGVKLYFMIGLPTETDEDILGIAELARKVSPLILSNAEGQARQRAALHGFGFNFCSEAVHSLPMGAADFNRRSSAPAGIAAFRAERHTRG